MSEELVTITPQLAVAEAHGAGVNFNSRFMQTKPATLVINQPNTQAEGAIRGHLRIVEQNLQFDKMIVTLLAEPEESRAWYAGEKSQMNRTPDNLMCFSRDLLKPDTRSKVPQAMQCGRYDPASGRWIDTCPKASWDAWRSHKEKTGQKDSKLIPPCEKSIKVALIDTVYKIPLLMYLRSNSKTEFEKQLEQLSRSFELLRAQGKQPNWFDLRFVLSTKPTKNANGTTSYLPTISEVKLITEDERALFGDLFLRYTSRGRPTQQQLQQSEQDAAIEAASDVIDAEIVTGTETNVVTGEVVI